MAVNVVLGPTAKVDVGPTLVPLRVLRGTIRDSADSNETTDSETLFLSKEFHPLGFVSLMIELEIQLDTDLVTTPTTAMFGGILALQPSNRISMNIWPQGRGVANSQWKFYQTIIRGGDLNFVVRGSNPQGGTIMAQSTGYYKRPFEADLGGTGSANVISR